MADYAIQDIQHPECLLMSIEWQKWRHVYEGGDKFIWNYLVKFSSRESDDDYVRRKRITYNPAHAKSAIMEIRNSIYQRMVDISREGGPASYQAAIVGDTRGVDLRGKSMNTFVGIEVLPELLVMARVGIFVDMPVIPDNPTLAEKGDKRPYLYIYRAEDIRSYQWDDDENPNEFVSLLLRDTRYISDDYTGLPTDTILTYRLLKLVIHPDTGQKAVSVTIFDEDGKIKGSTVYLNIPRIPFIMLETTESLLSDVANYQIALLNIASSDVSYCLTANYPFYTEQFNPAGESQYLKQDNDVAFSETNQFTFAVTTESNKEIRVGPTQGRRYPTGAERPAFIHPSAEPLQASMLKQEKMRDEIRVLVGLALSSIQPKMASAESKQIDSQGLEAGLSYIGLLLEHAERKIVEYWAMFEGTTSVATIQYPERYTLRSQLDTAAEITQNLTLLAMATSATLRRELCKSIAFLSIGAYVEHSIIEKIYAEIDKADVILNGMDSVVAAITSGFLSLESAAEAYGFPPEIVTKAADEHAARLDRIAKAQTPNDGQARGVRDLGSDPNAGKTEKTASRSTTEKDVPAANTRGPAQ